jgi:predicted permease
MMLPAWFEQFGRDIRYAFRILRQSPGFTASVVLSLALGIGVNTAIFSLVDALMLRWLPVHNPQELVQLKMRALRSAAPPGESLSYAIAKAFNGRKDIFSGAFGFTQATFTLGPGGSVESVQGAYVTGDCYQTLGLTPAAGRLLDQSDDQPGAPLVAVISHGFWQRRFGGTVDAIGRTLVLDRQPVTIVGVSAAGFTGVNVGAVADITAPVSALERLEPGAAGLLGPGNFWLRVLARPQRGLSPQQAQARLAVAWPQIAESAISPAWPAKRRQGMIDSTFELAPGATGYTYLREQFRKPLLVLMAVTGLVLLIACANVANLLLARSAVRRREISVRLAIGAGRARIVRQLLTESTLLSLLGAALGVELAWAMSHVLVTTLAAGNASLALDMAPNWHVLAFACGVAILNGVIFGLAPALQTTAGDRSGMLREDHRMTRSRSRLLSSLVSVQVALSLLLMVAAGLFGRTLQNLHRIDPGFRSEGVLLVDLAGQHEGYKGPQLLPFYNSLLSRVQQLPGVRSASIVSHTPLSGSTWSEAVMPKGQRLPDNDNARFVAAGPGLFATMQTGMIAGREFEAHDQGTPLLAIVNQTFAEKFFASRNPVGEYLTATVSNPPSDLEIVGVVQDAANGNIRDTHRPIVYVPYSAGTTRSGSLVIRAAGSLGEVAEAVRKSMQPSFPNTPLEVRGLGEQVERTLVRERLMAELGSGFGVLGLLLACVGLYGLLAYSVVRRTREIGVRLALGAQRNSVLWLIARGALRLVATGLAIGLPAAWLMSGMVKSMLFGLTPTDPLTLTGAAVLLALAGLAAGCIPARRAASVDPMTALRHE